MEIKDFFITPVFIIIVYALAFFIRPFVTEKSNKRYFIPGLTLKIFGAMAVGFIYQFYYGGGDTFTYFNLGSKYIWEAFKDSPVLAVKLIFAGRDYVGDTFEYASKIYTYGDPSSYFVVRVAECWIFLLSIPIQQQLFFLHPSASADYGRFFMFFTECIRSCICILPSPSSLFPQYSFGDRGY
jgi:hypothetical protein